MLRLAIVLLLAFCPLAAPAATCTWNVASGNWSGPANWVNCADAPGPSTRAPGMENSLIVGGISGNDISLVNDGDGDRASIIDLVNNTIVNADQHGLDIFNAAGDGNLSLHLYNNVFWNNGADGVHVGADSDALAIRAYNNQWDSFGGALTAGSANSTANPQLTGAFRPSEPGSPLINSGNDNPTGGLPSIDLNGLPRHASGIALKYKG